MRRIEPTDHGTERTPAVEPSAPGGESPADAARSALERALDEALDETYPASDPVALHMPRDS
jgi:hypothetical protein